MIDGIKKFVAKYISGFVDTAVDDVYSFVAVVFEPNRLRSFRWAAINVTK